MKTDSTLNSPQGEAAVRQSHPRGLYTLFFTEMWERFSYYGMRALLVLFMADTARGGMGLTDEYATAIYGLYTAGVYLAALPGGWVADRLLGARRAVWYGGIVIAAGHFALAIPRAETFYLGLMLLVVGTGLLKPNISTMVGGLYPEGGARRDAGFTIFYMGINLGATFGPLLCSFLGEKVNWHYGFAAAGVGMVLGLIQYRLTARHLGGAGLRSETMPPARRDWFFLYAGLGGLVLVVVLVMAGTLVINPVWLAHYTKWFIMLLALAFFVVLFAFGDLTSIERKRLGVIALLFVAAALFWSGFEQAGSSFNLFADRHTVRTVAGWMIPAGWFQSLNPVFLISLAPFIAVLWVALARRQLEVPLTVKFALGLLLLGVGFLVMTGAARLVITGHKVGPTWLIMTYLIHTIGELCLSPVGLSSVTKLSPPRLVGQMMGIWFLGASLGNLMAGTIAGEVTGDALPQMPGLFLRFALIACGAGLLLVIFTKPIKKLTGGVV